MTFRKGQSGNPGGRPKGEQSMTAALRAVLQEKADDGRSNGQIVALKVFELAQAGNLEAIKLAFDRLDGKVAERLEHSGPDGGDITLRVAVVDDRSDPD